MFNVRSAFVRHLLSILLKERIIFSKYYENFREISLIALTVTVTDLGSPRMYIRDGSAGFWMWGAGKLCMGTPSVLCGG